MKGHRKERLRVKITSTARYFAPRIVGGLCDAYPEVDISLEVLNRDGLVQRLRQNADSLTPCRCCRPRCSWSSMHFSIIR